jgi:hypothetical protein
MTSLADRIVDVLAPDIGDGLAFSAVSMQCRKMGILPENLSEETIEEFCVRFEKIMEIFAGEQVAQEISVKIRQLVK